jgi:hypothetical protein
VVGDSYDLKALRTLAKDDAVRVLRQEVPPCSSRERWAGARAAADAIEAPVELADQAFCGPHASSQIPVDCLFDLQLRFAEKLNPYNARRAS